MIKMSERVMVSTESMPYNLSTVASSELKYKIEQRFKEEAAYNRQFSPNQQQNESPGPPRISPKPQEYSEEPQTKQNSRDEEYEQRMTGQTENAAVYQTDGTISDYTEEGNRAAMKLAESEERESEMQPPDLPVSGMMAASEQETYNEIRETNKVGSENRDEPIDTEGNVAAMALTNEENLEERMNGKTPEESVGYQHPTITKHDEMNGVPLNYSNEDNVYTQLVPPSGHRSQQLITIDPSYLNAQAPEHSEGGTSQSALSAVLRSGYTVQNLTYLTPSHVTQTSIDNPGHLLPQADVEAFFSDMERPMATSVSLSGMYSTGTGQFTTLTNPPGLTLAQTYQTQNGSGRLISPQPPSYSDNQSDYGLTQLYSSRQGTIPSQYIGSDQGSSSSPTPQANAQWGTSTHDTLYATTTSSHTIGNQAQKYSYPQLNDSPVGRDDSQLPQYSRGLAAPNSYTGYLSQDLNTGGWYQSAPSPYSDVRPNGKWYFLHSPFCICTL